MLTRPWRFLVFLTFSIFLFAADILAEMAPDHPDQIWQVGARRWTIAQEQLFAQWVEHTINEDFFIRYNIPVDCADVPYAIRWIYARIAHLPAAVTTAEGTLLGHWSTAWSNLPTGNEWHRDQRFRQSLLTVLQATSTKTLPHDIYPIGITAGSLSAGAVFIEDGHSGMVGNIIQDGSTYSPIQTWEATLPRKVTKLRQSNYFSPGADKASGTGLMRFRWPVFAGGRWQYPRELEQPYYSLEQYHEDFCNTGEAFDKAVARRIDPKHYDPEKKAHLIIESLHRYLLERVDLVKAGFKHCRKLNCPEDSYLWEVYSTPSRDDMIDFKIIQLQNLIRDHALDQQKIAEIMEKIVLPIVGGAGGRTVTLQYVMENHTWLSHNPEDSIEARWGLAKCDMIRSRIQDSHVGLKFAEQTYRNTDPSYADRRREHLIQELESLHRHAIFAGCDQPDKR